MTPELRIAITTDNIAEVKRILSENKDMINSKDEDNDTPLIWATTSNKVEIVKFLLEQKASVDLSDKDGTALLFAASKSYYFMDGSFITHAANGWPIYPSIEEFSVLSKKNRSNNTEILKLLIENNASVNIQTKYGKTPLTYVLGNRYYEIAELIIKNKADVNTRSQDDETPLILAIEKCPFKIIKMLLDNGSLILEQDKWEWEKIINSKLISKDFPVLKLLADSGSEMIKAMLKYEAKWENSKIAKEFNSFCWHANKKLAEDASKIEAESKITNSETAEQDHVTLPEMPSDDQDAGESVNLGGEPAPE